MKKIILSIPLIIIALLSLTACSKEFDDSFKQSVYYTKIETSPAQSKDSENKPYYLYHQTFVNDKGETVKFDMKEYRSEPLKLDSYLKVMINKKDGVKSWEEISKNAIPNTALDKLNK
ncbi:MAG: YxeA family protein [Streptococcaceae bacterium]|nr:YxeA family protein [Streptococcaceae bacterium]